MQLNVIAETSSDGVVDRSFTVGEVPGVLWSPVSAAPGAPLLLMGHGGGLHKRAPGVVARARQAVLRDGFRVAAIDAPGHGERARSHQDEQWVTAMLRAREKGEPLAPIIAPFNGSLVGRAVPEWQATIDALQALPEIGAEAPIGFSGMTLASATGISLAVADPRIRAAIFGGVFVYDAVLEAARKVTIPLEFLLPWDDGEIDRDSGIALFDAFASEEKTLHAFPGSHFRVPAERIDTRFFARHLSAAGGAPAHAPSAAVPERLRAGRVLEVEEHTCRVSTERGPTVARYAPQLPTPRAERISPGHLVALARAHDGSDVVVWRWYDAVVLGQSPGSVRLWEPAHGEVTARPRRDGQLYAVGTRAYASAGLPGSEWWVAGPATEHFAEVDVELDDVFRLYTDHGLWTSALRPPDAST